MAQKGPESSGRTGRMGSAGASTAGETGTEAAPLVAVVVGADRVAANGDTANKIGTYSLSVLARYHGVAFVVAAPRTTIDLKTVRGADIVIEERKQSEVTVVKGPVVTGTTADGVEVDVDDVREVSLAPTDTGAWNPAFDVTPADLVDAIATEVGVAEKERQGFRLEALFGLKRSEARALQGKGAKPLPDPTEGP